MFLISNKYITKGKTMTKNRIFANLYFPVSCKVFIIPKYILSVIEK